MDVLEERKQELVGIITKQQDDKLKHLRSLIRRYSDDLEAAVTLVESAIQSMEEPHMPLFIQVRRLLQVELHDWTDSELWRVLVTQLI